MFAYAQIVPKTTHSLPTFRCPIASGLGHTAPYPHNHLFDLFWLYFWSFYIYFYVFLFSLFCFIFVAVLSLYIFFYVYLFDLFCFIYIKKGVTSPIC